MSGYPRWIRNAPNEELRDKTTAAIWHSVKTAKPSPPVSLPNAPSAEVGAHAEQSVSYRRPSDREMPASGSVHGTGAFVDTPQAGTRTSVPRRDAARGDA